MAVAAQSDISGERFTIADAMGLIAAAAIGLALARTHFEQVAIVDRMAAWLEYRGWVYRIALLILPFSAAVGWSRSRRPWRPARRLAREPGTVALMATAVTLLAVMVQEILSYTLPGPPGTLHVKSAWRPLIDPSGWLSAMVGPAILAAWATQGLGGHWRIRPGWIDRSGLALGMVWVALFLLRSWLLFHVPP